MIDVEMDQAGRFLLLKFDIAGLCIIVIANIYESLLWFKEIFKEKIDDSLFLDTMLCQIRGLIISFA